MVNLVQLVPIFGTTSTKNFWYWTRPHPTNSDLPNPVLYFSQPEKCFHEIGSEAEKSDKNLMTA